MIDYTWVPWLEELVTSIDGHDNIWLAERANAVEWQNDNPPLLRYGNENIDPLSFLYFLAQKSTRNLYQPVFQSVHEVFDIQLGFPETAPFIPRPTPPHCSVVSQRGVIQP